MNTHKLTYTFRCPLCAKLFRMDEPGEPCCTGPSETRDEHPLEVMHLAKVECVAVAPEYGARRAEGRLLMPGDDIADGILEKEALILRA